MPAITFFLVGVSIFFVLICCIYVCNGIRYMSIQNRYKRRAQARSPAVFIINTRRPIRPQDRSNIRSQRRSASPPEEVVSEVQIHRLAPPPAYSAIDEPVSGPPDISPPPSYREAIGNTDVSSHI